ncbi:glycolate oxidase subunit GlcD [Methylocucumis oryzae]|uniref:Glycolate oxidase subunit GlcD n=2 Tax=Methylocucumis oryzae TaxID=1632867 RepID=A0A0F3IIG4_9GAMM|nr:glycolate oxidase subunit GlcD [Methylocucumis oryzae]
MQPHPSEHKHHATPREELIKRLREQLPASAIISEVEALMPFECDGLSAYKNPPWLVVLPDTVEQVQHCLRCCYELNVPIVARGAGTGLAGGALPLSNGVLLSLTKLNRILAVNPDSRLAIVQPGVRNIAISQAAAAFGLYYAPDPSSQIACTIGGNIAENAGGVHCLKYGLTTHNVLSVKIVTITGELVELGSQGLDGPGYDLLAVVIGSEGLLGVVVEATVKLLPKPEHVCTLMAAFKRLENAAQAVSAIIASGLIPAGLEMMDKASIKAAEAFIHAGYPDDAEALLLCEFDGNHAQVVTETEAAMHIVTENQAFSIHIAEAEAERKQLWAGRKSAFPAIGRLSPDYYCMDGTIPRRHLAQVLQGIAELSAQYGLAVANVFHAGDGNLHPLILYNADVPGELAKAEQLGSDILRLSIDAGGTISGEHGVGIEKINQMCLQFSHAELEQFHALKQVFDAKGLLNPGKAVPSLARCAEFGAMHVHQGRLKFQELPRF